MSGKSLDAITLDRLRYLRDLQRRLDSEPAPLAAVDQFPNLVDLARHIEPRTIQTPALALIDEHMARVRRGEIDRLAISMPPQEGKSQRITRHAPLWFLLGNPDLRIVCVSYQHRIARRFGRAVRNDIAGHPNLGIELAQDSQAADEWSVRGREGGLYCVGVGGSLTSRSADLILIDDPLKGRKEANSLVMRDTVWDWYRSVALTRLGADSAVVVIQCMTGDTPVLMADGTQKPLRDIRPGDTVATYDAGGLSTSTVRNWANQGPDSVFSIRMKSGRVVRANARHPFLTIEENGTPSWRRTDQLGPGSVIQTVTGANGVASSARKANATSQPEPRACACRTTGNGDGLMVTALRQPTRQAGEPPTSNIGTASNLPGLLLSSPSKTASALSAACRPPTGTPVPIGAASCVSITTTSPAGFEGCFATTATFSLATEKTRASSASPLTTWSLTLDEVVEVLPAGTEDVFDLQIDHTENFIANGLVSHNTRWHEDDLTGRLKAEDDDEWTVLNIPAQADHDPNKGETDPLGRAPGEWLVSARGRTPAQWERKRRNVGAEEFEALYQGNPSPPGGTIFNRDWWRRYDQPQWTIRADGSCWAIGFDEVAQSWDMTFKDTTDSDWVVGQVWGRRGFDLYLLDQFRDKVAFVGACQAVRDLSARWPQATAKYVEDKANGPAIMSALRRIVPGLIPVEPDGSKVARAQAVSPFAQAGQMWLPAAEIYPWVAGFIKEHADFPRGRHDDQVDGTSQAGNRMLLNPIHTGLLTSHEVDDPDSDHEISLY